MDKHTKAPLTYMELPAADGEFMVLGGEGQGYGMVASCVKLEDARRIVACVNACAGSSTKWLEFVTSEDYADEFGKPVPFETRHGEILSTALGIMVDRDKLKVQRDELLAALKAVLEAPKDTLSDSKALREITRIARAAIAQAEGR